MTVFLDRNFIQQDSYTEKIMPLDEELLGNNLSEMWKDASRWKTGDKWRSFGWNVIEVDGHNHSELNDALSFKNQKNEKPTVLIAHTTKGKGVSFMENSVLWHYRSPQGKEFEDAISELKVNDER